ncbi:DHS-like NAD/FAD-binding domain-containing protein [Apodospora peruviana]|uniref:DHS-like NAD/FAD-binding domain-containing protein n=1 Tax=Apodospora peruviana TaxID=516989 RepID=A0AAE0IS46_9PEZI|nr:DHS-like NAD/FAD-binding domain-containing protein [Apodospora peruviana]
MECPQTQPSSPPSSPLSMLSNSPSLPSSPLVLDPAKRYPSPSTSSSSAPSGSASPMKPPDSQDVPGEIQVRTDGPPPSKRRRIATGPRPRTTEYIDLETPGDDEEEENLLRLLTALRKKKRIVVIAGAGISVSAGIPDFRSPTGLFATLRDQHKLKASGKSLFHSSVYKDDETTAAFHTMVRELADVASKAKPTPFHHMLASIAEEGRLLRLYTQNIDSLDTQMAPLATNVPLNLKGPWPTTIQLHGGLEKMFCTKCHHLSPFNASLFEGPKLPLCEKCKEQDEVRTAFAGKRSHGIGGLRPRMTLYDDENPDAEAIGNATTADLRRVPDAVIVVGTSLKVPGVKRIVKEMCQLTRSRRGGITAWINLDPEPPGVEFKNCWDLVVKGKCDDIAELVNLPRWDQQDIGDRQSYMVTGDQQKEQRYMASLNRDRIDVLLERKRKSTPEDDSASSQGSLQTPGDRKSKLVEQAQGGIPTPSASPKPRSPLPLAKPPTKWKNKGKQSMLIFSGTPASQPKDTAMASGRNKLPTAQRKPRQPKKEPTKPRNTLNHTFRATKAVAPNGRKTPKPLPVLDDVASSDLSSPPKMLDDFPSALPSLRPTNKPAASIAIKRERSAAFGDDVVSTTIITSSPPLTPMREYITQPTTISPGSKPRSMGHLID